MTYRRPYAPAIAQVVNHHSVCPTLRDERLVRQDGDRVTITPAPSAAQVTRLEARGYRLRHPTGRYSVVVAGPRPGRSQRHVR